MLKCILSANKRSTSYSYLYLKCTWLKKIVHTCEVQKKCICLPNPPSLSQKVFHLWKRIIPLPLILLEWRLGSLKTTWPARHLLQMMVPVITITSLWLLCHSTSSSSLSPSCCCWLWSCHCILLLLFGFVLFPMLLASVQLSSSNCHHHLQTIPPRMMRRWTNSYYSKRKQMMMTMAPISYFVNDDNIPFSGHLKWTSNDNDGTNLSLCQQWQCCFSLLSLMDDNDDDANLSLC